MVSQMKQQVLDDFTARLLASAAKNHIPTRYPNGLPGGVPAQVYQADEAQEALQLAEKVVTLVASKIK